ncbi:MAG: hypothetical protein JWM78_3451 [Verrucomicrobiaceae bacterium]|nr:hypothetical protein [Verrucomicrobiaceae bacterium]
MDFADLRLPVATRMQLNFIGLDYKRYPSEASLLGYRARESVLVYLPKKPPQVLLREGVKLEAKTVLQMGIVSFSSTIQLICEQPYTYLHFTWPHKVELEPLRRYPRFPLDTALTLTAVSAQGIATARLRGCFRDMSLQGARIALEKALPESLSKVLIHAKVAVAGMNQSLELHGEVKRAFGRDEKSTDPNFHYGISFTELPPPQRLLLLALCQELQGVSMHGGM